MASAAPLPFNTIFKYGGAPYDRLFAVSDLPRHIPYRLRAAGKRTAASNAGAYAVTNLSSLLNGDPGIPLGINTAGRVVFYDENQVSAYGGGLITDSYVINGDGSAIPLPCICAYDGYDTVSYAINNVGEAVGAFDYSILGGQFKGNIAWALQATSATTAYFGGYHNGDYALAV